MTIASQLAPGGTLRVGINLGNPVIAQRGTDGGEPRGVGAALGRELARRTNLPVRFITYETAGLMADAVRQGEWDVAFLAIDPLRAADIEFTAPYVLIEGAYIVRAESPIHTATEVDRPGNRIAVGTKTAYDLLLTREIKQAQLVRSPTSTGAIDMFFNDGIEVGAGIRQPLEAIAREQSPRFRVLDPSFMVIRQAAGVPRGRVEPARCVSEFIEQAKASGLVAAALKESGVGEVTVAPAAA